MPIGLHSRVKIVAVLAVTVVFLGAMAEAALAQTRTISFRNMHTNEKLTVTYKRNGQYVPDAMQQINQILRDWRRNESIRMNPKLIDLVYAVHQETGSKEPINVVSGYRSPVTNAALRRRSGGVARNSHHILGNAMDLYFPDVPVSKIREVALRFQSGGVGYYPRSGRPFVHIDVGNVRHWPRMTRQQLAEVFPNGNTQHIPSDGRPLPRSTQSTNIRIASYNDLDDSSASAPVRRPESSLTQVASADTGSGELNQRYTRDVAALPSTTNVGNFRIGDIFGRDASAASVDNTPAATADGETDSDPITIDVATLPMPVTRPTGDEEPGVASNIQLAALPMPQTRPEFTASLGMAASSPQTDQIGGLILASLPGAGYDNTTRPGSSFDDHGTRLTHRQPVVNDLVTSERAEGASFAIFTAPRPESMQDLANNGQGFALSFTSGSLGNASGNRAFEGPAVRALQTAFKI